MNQASTTSMQAERAAHTPGPWVAIPVHVRDNYSASKPIFTEGLWRILPESNVERCPIAEVDRADDHDLPTRLSAKADALLIAAAPDLLEALENLLYDMAAGVSHTTGCFEAARAAVAKARGEA